MAALHNVGADAPGPVTPTSDNARQQAGAEGGQAHRVSLDCAAALRRAQLAGRAIAVALWAAALALAAAWGWL